jgi:hypothetical protein
MPYQKSLPYSFTFLSYIRFDRFSMTKLLHMLPTHTIKQKAKLPRRQMPFGEDALFNKVYYPEHYIYIYIYICVNIFSGK